MQYQSIRTAFVRFPRCSIPVKGLENRCASSTASYGMTAYRMIRMLGYETQIPYNQPILLPNIQQVAPKLDISSLG